VQDALALAGGPSPEGMRDRVELVRGGTRLVQRLGVGTAIDQTALESGDQLFVPQRSWIARNTWLASSLIAASTTIIAFSSR